MFDLATRMQPIQSVNDLVGVPFDLRLCAPTAPSSCTYTEIVTPTGEFAQAAELLASYSCQLEDTLQTAIIISLFTDRRADADDALPLNETARRGWLGDEYMAAGFEVGEVDAWGSKLWLLYYGKVQQDKLPRARFAAQEALAWMIRNGLASRIEVQALWVGQRADRLAIRPTIFQEENTQPIYDVLWGTSIRRAEMMQ